LIPPLEKWLKGFTVNPSTVENSGGGCLNPEEEREALDPSSGKMVEVIHRKHFDR
jgi:hypothetical protein